MKDAIITAVFFFFFVGVSLDISITFKPFSIKVGDWYGAASMIFLFLFVLFSTISIRKKEYFKGYKDGLEDMRIDIQKEYDLTKKP